MRNERRLWGLWGLALVGVVTSCSWFTPSSRVLYQEGRTVIQLEQEPSEGGNKHPAVIVSSQLAKLLDGMLIQHDRGLAMSFLRSSATFEPVFNSDEIATLAPLLSKGLKQADPSQRVGFTFWSATPGRGYAPFSGSIAARDPYLIFALKTHPGSDWRDPENPPPPSQFALDFRQDSYLKPGSEEERRGSYEIRPTLQIDYRRYLAALDGQSGAVSTAKEPLTRAPAVSAPAEVRPPAVPSPVAAPRDSVQSGTEQAMREELARLRQELAETKQLLADKILELNRLQKKAGGTNEGKQ